jgi:exodeoxyribonuclease V gamma subunit
MRSIPHRVICLLGLDDGSFPRHIERDGDDLTAQEPRVGDRDVRSEDRQLLLDALLAAGDKLIVTYSGHDERSNLPRPPAVPVGELLDVVDRTVRTERGAARRAVVVTHPLQPFDARNYTAGELVDDGPWSFDTVNLGGALAAAAPREAPQPFLTGLLPEREGAVSLDLLDRFVRHPVRVFLRERLSVSLYDRTREFDDAIPIDLGGLEKWEIGDRLLRARLGGADWARCTAAEAGRGGLPPGALATPVLAEMETSIEALVEAALKSGGDVAPEVIDVELALPGQPEVVGSVPGVRGDVLHLVTYRRLQPALRLAAWVRLVAATEAQPERSFTAVTIGRAERNASRAVAISTMSSLGGDTASRRALAEASLRVLVEVFGRGMREPLPLYCNTSAAYAAARAAGADDAVVAARAQWETKNRDVTMEDNDRHHLYVFGEPLSFNELMTRSGAPDDDEPCPVLDFDQPERTRFGLYARLLWDELLRHERLTYQ